MTLGTAKHLMNKVDRSNPDFKYLGGGISREVYVHKDFPDYVFKLGSRHCNEREYTLFNQATPAQRERLASVFFISDTRDVIVMERIKGRTGYSWCEFHNKSWDVAYCFGNALERLLKPLGIGDIHGDNFMWCERRMKWVVVDYAF